jgi:hypothetical protein
LLDHRVGDLADTRAGAGRVKSGLRGAVSRQMAAAIRRANQKDLAALKQIMERSAPG